MRFAVLGATISLIFSLSGCGGSSGQGIVITFPSSAVGKEAVLLSRQLERFMKEHPEIRVVQRKTPDAADQRHQLYVQWLNARANDPAIVQLDVIWTAEFAAAGWILALERFNPKVQDFFSSTIKANSWKGKLYALPWFVDVGMLYWRSDLLDHAPGTFDELSQQATAVKARAGLPYGFLWQGARYEGLVCVFLEHLGGFGGKILDDDGRVVVDSQAAVHALTYMRDSIYLNGIVPQPSLTWQEEPTRFAFQNGQAVFLRNWPYAYPLMQDRAQSKVAGKFAVAPMPVASLGAPTATLGGSQLAINANAKYPDAAYEVIAFLTRPEQMRERAQVAGQYPPMRSLYDDQTLEKALAIPPQQVCRIIERATPRPVTPVYTQLSDMLQIRLHRALTRQEEPTQALSAAAKEMQAFLNRVELSR